VASATERGKTGVVSSGLEWNGRDLKDGGREGQGTRDDEDKGREGKVDGIDGWWLVAVAW